MAMNWCRYVHCLPNASVWVSGGNRGMFSWFSRCTSSAGGNGVRGHGDCGCGMDWEGDDCSSTAGGDWGMSWTTSTARKENSMGGSTGTSATGGAGAGSAAKRGSSTMKVPVGASGAEGNSQNCGGSMGGGRGSDSSASSAQPAIFL